jgi:hypothetical protein
MFNKPPMYHLSCCKILVSATKILAVKADTSIGQAHLPCRLVWLALAEYFCPCLQSSAPIKYAPANIRLDEKFLTSKNRIW